MSKDNEHNESTPALATGGEGDVKLYVCSLCNILRLYDSDEPDGRCDAALVDRDDDGASVAVACCGTLIPCAFQKPISRLAPDLPPELGITVSPEQAPTSPAPSEHCVRCGYDRSAHAGCTKFTTEWPDSAIAPTSPAGEGEAWEAIDAALTGLREPMELQDAQRVRTMLTHVYVAHKKNVARLSQSNEPNDSAPAPREEDR